MGKLAVAGASVLAGGGVSAGGVMLSRMFSFDSTLPDDLEKFQEGNGGGCVQSLFPGLQSVNGKDVAAISSSPKIQSGFFDASNKDKVSGCLVVNWDKHEYSDKKWKGDFRFLWAVQQESHKKGFIVFTTLTTTNDSEKKLLWKGVAYSLDKDDATGWKLSNKKEVSSTDKKTDKSATDNKFPKAHADLTSKSFWGFMKDNGDMDKMCGESDCTGTSTPSYFQGYWVWNGSSTEKTKKLDGWSSNNISGSDNSNSWWEHLFGKTEWDMGEVVKDMTGTWEEKVWYGIDKQSSN